MIGRRRENPIGKRFRISLAEGMPWVQVVGVAGHIHMHVLPRWVADANFASVIGETRVLPEALEVTWTRIRGAFGNS